MQHYHEALNNARKNPKDTWNLLRQLVPGSKTNAKQNKCNFQNPTRSANTFNNFFATAGEKTYNDVKQRHQTNGFDVQAKHERTDPRSTDHEKVLVVESPTRTGGRCNISYIETEEH